MFRALLIATFVGCFLCFTWAIFFLFKKSGAMPTRMRWLGLAGLVCFAVELTWMLISDIPFACLCEFLSICSLGIFWYAVFATRKAPLGVAFGNLLPDYLIRGGPYRWVRHPFYLAYTLFWTSGAVASSQPFLLAIPIIMGAFYWSAARAEEKTLLASRFGQDYAVYIRRTGMFLPRLPVLLRR